VSALGLRLWLAALCLLSPALSVANNTRPDIIGTHLGSVDVSAGTSWTALTSSSLKCATTGAACAAGLTISAVTVINTHASQTLYLTLRSAGIVDSTTNTLAIGAGDSLSLNVYGMRVTALSLQGSGASTTGRVIAHLLPN
jgi:hypothetical protein